MSSADYYLYQEAISSPGVSLSTGGRFSGSSPQLLVARRNLLQLYDLDRCLRLVTSCPLQGTVKALETLVHSSYETDLVLLGFDEAKVVTLVYDPPSNAFQTVAMHSFEREDFATRMTYHDLRIVVDPEYRCFMVLLPFDRLGIVPLRIGNRPVSAPETDPCYMCALFRCVGKNVYLPSFTLELSSFSISNLVSAAFTRESVDPTLLLVAQEVPGADLTSISRVALNLRERRGQVTLKHTDMPPDVVNQIPLPPPLGGQLIICAHSLIHDVEGQMTTHQMKADLTDSACCLFDPLKLLLATRSGEVHLVLLNCFTEGETCFTNEGLDALKLVLSMKLPFQGQPMVSQLVSVEKYVWLGSRLHDSKLYQLVLEEQYGTLGSGEVRKIINLQSVKVETLATAISAVILPNSSQSASSELLIAHGYGRCSYISHVYLSAIPSYRGVIQADALPRRGLIDRLISIPGAQYDLFLLATSTAGFTITLRAEDIIEDVSDVTDFSTEAYTLLAGSLGNNLLYQVTTIQIRILTDKGKMLKEFPGDFAVQAAYQSRFFSLLMASGVLETVEIDLSDGIQEKFMPKIADDPEIMSINLADVDGRTVLTLVRADGCLEMYNVRTAELISLFPCAGEGLALLSPDKDGDWVPITDVTQKVPSADFTIPFVDIREIAMRQFGDMVILLLRSALSQVYVYTHFGPFVYRFKRVSSPLYMGEMFGFPEASQAFFLIKQKDGEIGFFVLHPKQSFWVIPDVKHRKVQIHPSFRQQIQAFSPFNYIDSEYGFVHLAQEQLVITRMDDDLGAVLSSEVLALRLAFLDTPRQLVLHDNTVFASFFSEDDKGVMYSLRCFALCPDRSLPEVCNIPKFSLNEVLLDLAVVTFTRKVTQPNTYLAVATGVCGSEDTECKGRLFLFSFENRSLKEEKVGFRPALMGTITAVAAFDGYLLAAVSFEIKLFSFVEESEAYLEEIAFFRSPFLCIHFDVFQNYVLCVDVRKSVYILGYRELHNQREMLQLGSFHKDHNCLSCGFVLLQYEESEEHGMRAIACDDLKNLYILDTVPWTEKMEKVGEFHTGLSVHCLGVCGHGRILCATEGVVAWVSPMPGQLFKKMHTLQNAMFEMLPGSAGLNTRGYRHPITHDRERQRYLADQGNGAYARGGTRSTDRDRQRKSILDRETVLSFCYLSSKIQNAIGRNIGATPGHILPEIGLLATAQEFL